MTKKQGNEEANTNTNENISNCTDKLPSLCFVCSYVAFFVDVCAVFGLRFGLLGRRPWFGQGFVCWGREHGFARISVSWGRGLDMGSVSVCWGTVAVMIWAAILFAGVVAMVQATFCSA